MASVDGAAARLGRHRPGERHASAAKLRGADGQGGECAVDRRFADPADGGEAFAEPHDPRKGVYDGEAVLHRSRDPKTAHVGSKNKPAISVQRGIPPPEKAGG